MEYIGAKVFFLFTLLIPMAFHDAQAQEAILNSFICPVGNVYYVTFASRSQPFPGHAFVVWSSDDNQEGLCKYGALGKAPHTSDSANSSAIAAFREVDGKVKFEPTNETIDDKLSIPVDRSQYDLSLQIAQDFLSDGKYMLVKNDCVEYAKKVAKLIGLKVPNERSLSNLTPSQFIHNLIEINHAAVVTK